MQTIVEVQSLNVTDSWVVHVVLVVVIAIVIVLPAIILAVMAMSGALAIGARISTAIMGSWVSESGGID